MLVAVLLALVVWSSPAPSLWICDPGHSPTGAPSNCERLHFTILEKARF